MTMILGKRPTGGLITNGLIMAVDVGNNLSYRQGVSTTSIKDLSGKAADLNATSNRYTADKGGGWDTTDGNVLSSVSNAITVPNAFTMGIWIYATNRADDPPGPIMTIGSVTGTGIYNASNITNNHIGCQFINDVGGTPFSGPTFFSKSLYTFAAYQYYVLTYNGSALTFYKNAVSEITNSPGGTHLNANTPTQYFISRTRANPAHNTRFNFYMAHIYNRALSATEVTQNYNLTRSRFGL